MSQHPAPRASLGILMPFAAPIAGGFLVALIAAGSEGNPVWMTLAALLLVLAGASAVLLVRERLPRPLDLVPPLACIGVVAAVRVALPGSNPAYGALFLLPLVWVALNGTRAQLGYGLVAATGALVLSGSLQPERWIEAIPVLFTGPVVCFTIQRLVTKIRGQAASLEELARRDALTGAVTERAWAELFDREIMRADRSRDPLAIALLNIDGLSEYNERFGQDCGDELLRSTVGAWQRELRGGDILGRVGGDSFAALLPACSATSAHLVAERLRTATSELQTCSIGVAEWHPGESREHVMYRVHSALRSAKQAGRDQVVVARIDLPERDALDVTAAQLHEDAAADTTDEPVASPDEVQDSVTHDEPAVVPAADAAAVEDEEEIAVVAAAPADGEDISGDTADEDASALRQLLRELSSTH